MLLGVVVLFKSLLIGQGGEEPPNFSLDTDAGDVLVSRELDLQIPSSAFGPRLELDFGFATDEIGAAGTLMDSFSITLQIPNDPATTTLLLTTDAFGVHWAPPNAGGLAIDETDISREAAPFPGGDPELDLKFSFRLSFPVPSSLAGRSAVLFLDLFNNQNETPSRAVVNGIEILTDRPVDRLIVQSAASPAGPFADEPNVDIDEAEGVATVRLSGRPLFFNIRSEAAVTITGERVEGEHIVLDYAFAAPTAVLESSPNVDGPYSEVAGAIYDAVEKTVVVNPPAGNRFFRLRSTPRTVIVATESDGIRLVFRYAFQPATLALQTSTQPDGPFSDESGVKIDVVEQTMRRPRNEVARFFRVISDPPVRLTGLAVGTNEAVLQFEP